MGDLTDLGRRIDQVVEIDVVVVGQVGELGAADSSSIDPADARSPPRRDPVHEVDDASRLGSGRGAAGIGRRLGESAAGRSTAGSVATRTPARAAVAAIDELDRDRSADERGERRLDDRPLLLALGTVRRRWARDSVSDDSVLRTNSAGA